MGEEELGVSVLPGWPLIFSVRKVPRACCTFFAGLFVVNDCLVLDSKSQSVMLFCFCLWVRFAFLLERLQFTTKLFWLLRDKFS